MGMKNDPQRKAIRRDEAMDRREARDSRTHLEQMALLQERPGESRKEKARLREKHRKANS